jgi:cystathionine beta-lyase/cystathionine gamma-synthase
MKRIMGIEPALIRLSAGLEELEDLKNDIDEALNVI